MKERLLQSLVAAGVACALACPAGAADSRLEYEVKAAFLYNFAKFVEWPTGVFPEADSPLRLCVLDASALAKVVDRTVQDRTAQGRSIIVQREVDAGDPSGCHLLFVGDVGGAELARIVQIAGDAPVLTVGESESFVEDGGIIRLFVEGGKIRFEVNAGAAERARLKVSSQLLKLARAVRR